MEDYLTGDDEMDDRAVIANLVCKAILTKCGNNLKPNTPSNMEDEYLLD